MGKEISQRKDEQRTQGEWVKMDNQPNLYSKANPINEQENDQNFRIKAEETCHSLLEMGKKGEKKRDEKGLFQRLHTTTPNQGF